MEPITRTPCEIFLIACDHYDRAKRELDCIADRLAPAVESLRNAWRLARIDGEDVHFEGLPSGFRINGDWPTRKMIASAIAEMKRAEGAVHLAYNALSETHKRRFVLPWVVVPK